MPLQALALQTLPLIAYIGRTVFIIVATTIFIISLLAYLRLRNKKTLLLSVGFGLFVVHAILAITELFVSSFNANFTTGYHLLLDSVALSFILVGALRN